MNRCIECNEINYNGFEHCDHCEHHYKFKHKVEKSQNELKLGDLVKYSKQNYALDNMGFVIGQFYEVMTKADGGLVKYIAVNSNVIILEDDGIMTDNADHFTKHECPILRTYT